MRERIGLALHQPIVGPVIRQKADATDIRRKMLHALDETGDWRPASSSLSRWSSMKTNGVYRKPYPNLMRGWNLLSWRNDRAALFGPGRPGLAIHPEESQSIVLRLSCRIRRR